LQYKSWGRKYYLTTGQEKCERGKVLGDTNLSGSWGRKYYFTTGNEKCARGKVRGDTNLSGNTY